MTHTIVVVEDDAQIRRVVEGYLRGEGYRVLTASDGPTGLATIQRERPALIILDVMLPGIDGLELIRRLRSSDDPLLEGVYIIMLTARVEETDRIVGLELGADDYVPKPFSPRELAARVRAALRRLESDRPGSSTARKQAGGLVLDPIYRTASLDGTDVALTATEFDLLNFLMQHPGRPFTRGRLLDITQPDALGDAAAYERTIDAHIKNIRQKLGDSGRHNRYIETVQGVGYRFVHEERPS